MSTQSRQTIYLNVVFHLAVCGNTKGGGIICMKKLLSSNCNVTKYFLPKEAKLAKVEYLINVVNSI